MASQFLCVLVVTLLLVACNSGDTTPPVSPSYTGDGYTLNYPQGWIYRTQETLVLFTSNSDPTTTLTINVTDPVLGTTLDGYFTDALNTLRGQIQNYKTDDTVTVAVTIGSEPWKVVGLTGDKDGKHLKGAILVDQHPAITGDVFVITLLTKADNYDQVYSTTFKSMLESFKFTPVLPEKD